MSEKGVAFACSCADVTGTVSSLVLRSNRLEVHAQRSQFSVKVCALHADPLGELPNLAVTKNQLLLQIGAFELLASLAQRQR